MAWRRAYGILNGFPLKDRGEIEIGLQVVDIDAFGDGVKSSILGERLTTPL